MYQKMTNVQVYLLRHPQNHTDEQKTATWASRWSNEFDTRVPGRPIIIQVSTLLSRLKLMGITAWAPKKQFDLFPPVLPPLCCLSVRPKKQSQSQDKGHLHTSTQGSHPKTLINAISHCRTLQKMCKNLRLQSRSPSGDSSAAAQELGSCQGHICAEMDKRISHQK